MNALSRDSVFSALLLCDKTVFSSACTRVHTPLRAAEDASLLSRRIERQIGWHCVVQRSVWQRPNHRSCYGLHHMNGFWSPWCCLRCQETRVIGRKTASSARQTLIEAKLSPIQPHALFFALRYSGLYQEAKKVGVHDDVKVDTPYARKDGAHDAQ